MRKRVQELAAGLMPRKKRKAVSKVPTAVAPKKSKPTHAGAPKRPLKYREWTEESMLNALKAVSQGMSMNRAALEFNVPRTTLKDHCMATLSTGQ